MKLRKVLENTFWFGTIPRLSSVVMLVIMPIVTPYLTKQDWGVNGLITSYTAFLIGFSALGMHVHLSNTYYELGHNFSYAWRRLAAILYIGAFIAAFAMVIVLWLVLDDEMVQPYGKPLVVFLYIMPVLMEPINVLANQFYPLIGKAKPMVFRNFAGNMSGVLMFFICAYVWKLGFLSWALYALTQSLVIGALFFKPLFVDNGFMPSFNISKRHLKYWFIIALPMIPHSIGIKLLHVADRMVMGVVGVDKGDIGIYTCGLQFPEYIVILGTALAAALTPIAQRCYRDGETWQMRRMYQFMSGIMFFTVFICCIWMKEIYTFFIRTGGVEESFKVATFMCFAQVFFPVSYVLSLFVMVQKRTKLLWWLVLIPSIINLILNFIFIPIFGYFAAVVTSLLSYWMVVGVGIFHPKYRAEVIRVFGSLKVLYFTFIAGLVLMLISYNVSLLSVSLKFVASFIAFSILAYVVYVKRDSIKSFNFKV